MEAPRDDDAQADKATLLGLPREMRDKILNEVIRLPPGCNFRNGALFRVNKQVYHEAYDITLRMYSFVHVSLRAPGSIKKHKAISSRLKHDPRYCVIEGEDRVLAFKYYNMTIKLYDEGLPMARNETINFIFMYPARLALLGTKLVSTIGRFQEFQQCSVQIELLHHTWEQHKYMDASHDEALLLSLTDSPAPFNNIEILGTTPNVTKKSNTVGKRQPIRQAEVISRAQEIYGTAQNLFEAGYMVAAAEKAAEVQDHLEVWSLCCPLQRSAAERIAHWELFLTSSLLAARACMEEQGSNEDYRFYAAQMCMRHTVWVYFSVNGVEERTPKDCAMGCAYREKAARMLGDVDEADEMARRAVEYASQN